MATNSPIYFADIVTTAFANGRSVFDGLVTNGQAGEYGLRFAAGTPGASC